MLKSFTHHSVETDEFPNIEFELDFRPSSYKDEIIIKQAGDRFVVGYLVDDEHCENPLEDCDSVGKIYTAHRNSTTAKEMQEALGLDDNWEPDLDLIFYDDCGNRQLVDDEYIEHFCKHTTTDVCRELGWEQQEFESDDAFVLRCAETDLNEHYYNGALEYQNEFDAIKLRWWQKLRNEHKIGAPYAILLDVYSHSGENYSISGQGMQCRWDTARGGAIWVPDKYLLQYLMDFPKDQRNAKARENCEMDLKTFNSWLAGDCWGIVVQTNDADGAMISADSCWGHIGSEWAAQELQRQIEYEVNYILTNSEVIA